MKQECLAIPLHFPALRLLAEQLSGGHQTASDPWIAIQPLKQLSLHNSIRYIQAQQLGGGGTNARERL
jgi:hypothetical protein